MHTYLAIVHINSFILYYFHSTYDELVIWAFRAFLRFRTVMTSFCLSPSTSTNLRLISEYLCCNSFSSVSIELFLSFSNDNSAKVSQRLPPPLLSIVDISASFSDKCTSLPRTESNQ